MGICALHAFLYIVKCLESPKVLYKFPVIINSNIMVEESYNISWPHLTLNQSVSIFIATCQVKYAYTWNEAW